MNGPETPRKRLQEAIVQAISPQPSENTKKAVEIAKKQRKRVQANKGDVLTTPEVLERLQEEAMARQVKKQKSSKKCHKDLVGIGLLNNNEQEDNEISEDEDDTACNICKILWKTYTKKRTWLTCDICNHYVRPKWITADIDLDDEFYCSKCSA